MVTRGGGLINVCLFIILPILVPPGICEVDNTPKGWFIKYVDRSPATLAKLAVSVGSLY